MSGAPLPIGEHAFVGDRRTGALITRDGAVVWLCLPDFDAPAVFAALLGTSRHGSWVLSPRERARSTRRYVGESMVLETTHRTQSGEVRVTDFMTGESDRSDLLRRVEGVSGTVEMTHEWRVRPWYGSFCPWMRVTGDDPGAGEALVALAGPDRLTLRGPGVADLLDDGTSTLTVSAGDVLDFDMSWRRAIDPSYEPVDVDRALEEEVAAGEEWLRECDHEGPYADQLRRSLLVLRHLTHQDTGGMVAALTTSLPEDFGGVRNWDYRFCWLRDSALVLEALLAAGYSDKARAWRDWLLRAVGADPRRMQIMYRIDAGHDLPEREIDHLPGYAGSAPVRIGNGAVGQRQTDVLGEVMIALEAARDAGIEESADSAALQVALVDELAEHWRELDHGIWEVRGELRAFTHSRVMVWVAMDTAVRATEAGVLPGGPSVGRWRRIRDEVRREVDREGVSASRGCFTQYYGTDEVDASLLLLPIVGFCAADDPRFVATVAAIEQDLMRDGLLLRYRTSSGVDGLDGDEHPFLICCFWLVQAYVRMGRMDDARACMDRLVALTNDVGLLAEEVDGQGRFSGNFPQAFSHLGLVLAALDLERAAGDPRA